MKTKTTKKPKKKEKDLVTLQAYADKCKVAKATVYNWIDEKLILPEIVGKTMCIDLVTTPILKVRKRGRISADEILAKNK